MNYQINKILSSGSALGKIKVIRTIKHKNEKKDTKVEIEKFDSARKKALASIAELKEKEPSLSEYLIVQELMINDPLLIKKVNALIEENMSAQDAVKKAMESIISELLNSDSQYLKERVSDIEDITHILINNINGIEQKNKDEKYILVVDDLLPSYLVNNHNNVIGIIAKKGGFTSHSAIIARIWDIPYVVADIDAKNKDTAIIDTRTFNISINPSEEEINRYKDEMNQTEKFTKKAIKHSGFKFMANVATNRDIKRAMDYKFDGVGLFRTEFIFMNTTRPYTLIEHYKMYSTATKEAKGKPITFRTFDVKEDKTLPYLKVGKKSVETYKKNKDIFENQIKAILASNINGNVRIMFPMIETKEDFTYLKDWVIRIQKENNYNLPLIGMMLETKKALKNIEDFTDVDFISIGTNDLTKELYNINRNEMAQYEGFIDDLMKELRRVAVFAEKHNIYLSVCGELASIKEVAIRFYEIGIRALSVSPALIRNLNLAFTEFTQAKRRLFVVGDSTLAKFNDVAYLYPRCGFGEKLKNYFDSDHIEIVNLALSGRSAKSYLLENNYQRLINEIKPADFILVGFGHNDQKEDDLVRYSNAFGATDEAGSFKNVLYENYIKLAYDKMATIIFSTPIPRITPDNKYKGLAIHNTPNGNYVKALLELGKEFNIPVVNLTKPLATYYEEIGYSNVIYHHAITKAKDMINDEIIPDILSVDKTHLNEYGADYVAYIFAKELKRGKVSLRHFLKEEIVEPKLYKAVNPEFKFIKYQAPDLDSYKPNDLFKSDTDGIYGTYFGDYGNNDQTFTATIKDGVGEVGTKDLIGQINAGSTAIAFLFKQIPLNKNMKASAKMKVITAGGIKQTGFGLMIRDDCYINQDNPRFLVSSNEIGCGLLTSDNQTCIFYSKEEYTNIKKEPNTFLGYFKANDVIQCEIERIGQRISLSLDYKNQNYKKDYYDFDLQVIDNKYYYVGVFATNGTLVNVTDFKIELLNDAKEA